MAQQKVLIYHDNYNSLDAWQVEMETPGTVRVHDGVLDIDVPAGVSVWFRRELEGAIVIEYDAFMVSEGGPNDWNSDLNCFWMASDPRRRDFFQPARSGKFEDYNAMLTYYVGQGGNRNTSTRFRRYIGDENVRPLLPENDLSAPETLLKPNLWQHIRVVADGATIQYFRDGVRLFNYHDDAPLTRGYFAIRTTKNHMRVRDFRVYRLK